MEQDIMPTNIKHKKKKVLATSCAIVMAVSFPLALTACSSSSSSSNDNTVAVSQTAYQIELDAINTMCNGALKLTVTDVQRRPTSIFSGASISSAGGGSSSGYDGTSDTQISTSTTTDIAIEVDVSLTWNVNTYTQAVAATGASSSNAPSTLGDILIPGSYMYISGTDSDGNPYMSADIISPSSQENINALAINAQWDYDILNSSLPETSVTKTGSILFRVPSTVNDLQLNILTPMGGQAIGSDITSSTTYSYVLELS
jgi:hypothetical protein